MKNKKTSGLLCFLIVSKYLGVNIPKECEERFQGDRDTYQEIISVSKKLHLKVSAGKLSLKKVSSCTVPVIAKLKDDCYILLLNKQKDKWSILDPTVGNPESIDYCKQRACCTSLQRRHGGRGQPDQQTNSSINNNNRVGRNFSALSHHRTCRSAYGGSI